MKNNCSMAAELQKELTEKEIDADIINRVNYPKTKKIEQRQPRATLEPGKVTSNARLLAKWNSLTDTIISLCRY